MKTFEEQYFDTIAEAVIARPSDIHFGVGTNFSQAEDEKSVKTVPIGEPQLFQKWQFGR